MAAVLTETSWDFKNIKYSGPNGTFSALWDGDKNCTILVWSLCKTESYIHSQSEDCWDMLGVFEDLHKAAFG